MEITINKKEKGLVRVVIGVANRYTNRLSTNYNDCEENGNIRAVGFWHRHDDPNVEAELTKEANLILAAYGKMWNYSGSLIEVEWKEYRK